MTVMDKVEGWEEEKWVGSRLAECMWIHTQAVLYTALWWIAHATNVSAEICKCGCVQIARQKLGCWLGDEGVGTGRMAVSALPQQRLGRRHVWCMKVQRDPRKMARTGLSEFPLSHVILTETEAVIVAEGFGIVPGLDSLP